MTALHRQAAGVLDLWPIMVSDMPALLAEALSSGGIALRVVEAIARTLAQFEEAPHGPPLCGCCSRTLEGDRFAFVYTQPRDVPYPSRVLVLAICERCGIEREEVRAAAVKALQSLWPDARPITVTHPAGGCA